MSRRPLFAAALAALALAACSGRVRLLSSDSAQDATASADAGRIPNGPDEAPATPAGPVSGGPVSGSAADGGAPFVGERACGEAVEKEIICGQTLCAAEAGEVCCDRAGSAPTCARSCPAGDRVYKCDGPEDCGGAACCRGLGCAVGGTCPGSVQLCHATSDCPEGMACACFLSGPAGALGFCTGL